MSVEHEEVYILKTKLHRPPVTSDLMCRPRLHKILDAGLEKPLTLISAPAGYGKSMLLSHWVESLDRNCAWLSLDENDSALTVFLSYFIAAIDSVCSGDLVNSKKLLKAQNLPSLAAIGGILLNEIDAHDEPLVLVLDDYHRITKPEVHQLLSVFLDHPTPNLHIIIATRHDPPLRIISLGGLGKINQVRLQDLEFTLTETRALIAPTLTGSVSVKAINNVHASVEGWAVGLRLVVLALSYQDDSEHFLKGLGRGFAPMQEFLLNEVLVGQTSVIRDGLLKVSVLDRFCAALCESACLTEEDGSGPIMDGQMFINSIKQSNLFCLALDNSGYWFRFHHQFRTLLQARLKSEYSKQEIDLLYERASHWSEEKGLIDEAIKYAVKIHDSERASALVLKYGGELILQEQGVRMESWLRQISPKSIEQDPRLMVLLAWTHYFRLQMPEWKIAIDRAFSRITEMELTAEERALQLGFLDSMRSSYYYLTSQLAEASESAANAMEYVPPEFQRLRVHAVVVMCLCLHATGKHKKAKAFLEKQFKEPDNQIPQIQVLLLTMNCCLSWLDGEVSEMRQEYLRLHRVAGESGVYQHQIWAETFPATGAYWCNDLDEVEQLLGFEIQDPFLIHLITLQDLAVVLVFTHLARGRIIEAQNVAGSLTDFALDIGNPGLNRIGEGLQAEIALAAGTFDQANQWASVFSEKQPEVQFTCYIPEFTLAKVLISQNADASRERCADVLESIEKFARSTHIRSFLIIALGLKAIFLDQGNDREGALEVLAEALSLASVGGGTRFFLDLGQPLARLLESMSNLAENDHFTLRLMHEFAAEETHLNGNSGQIEHASKNDESTVSDQPILTRRELDVLQLLVRRLRDKQIATQLFISTETVKTHLKNIFQKLDVHSREQAVVRARELDIQCD